MNHLSPKLSSFIDSLDFSSIGPERKKLLQPISSYIQEKLDRKDDIYLNFVCTHNSRRSQLCQVWSEAAAYFFGMENFRALSAGTKATAFHPNAVRALKEVGFSVSKPTTEENPVYQVQFSEKANALNCFSKSVDELLPDLPSFAVVFTCSDAEVNCPFIPGAEANFPLKYEDPKQADGSSQEKQVYAERNRQIATELFYLFSEVKA